MSSRLLSGRRRGCWGAWQAWRALRRQNTFEQAFFWGGAGAGAWSNGAGGWRRTPGGGGGCHLPSPRPQTPNLGPSQALAAGRAFWASTKTKPPLREARCAPARPVASISAPFACFWSRGWRTAHHSDAEAALRVQSSEHSEHGRTPFSRGTPSEAASPAGGWRSCRSGPCQGSHAGGPAGRQC